MAVPLLPEAKLVGQHYYQQRALFLSPLTELYLLEFPEMHLVSCLYLFNKCCTSFLKLGLLMVNAKSLPKSMRLHSPYYVEACNELRGPSLLLSTWAIQLRRNTSAVATLSRWRDCVRFERPGNRTQTFFTDCVVLRNT